MFTNLNTLYYLPVQFSIHPPMVYKCRQHLIDTRDLTMNRIHHWKEQVEQTNYRVMVVFVKTYNDRIKVNLSTEYSHQGNKGYTNSNIICWHLATIYLYIFILYVILPVIYTTSDICMYVCTNQFHTLSYYVNLVYCMLYYWHY